jgi:hypothetical protein
MVRYQTNSHRDKGSIECIGKHGIAVEEAGYMCPHPMHVVEMSFNADHFVKHGRMHAASRRANYSIQELGPRPKKCNPPQMHGRTLSSYVILAPV